MRKYRCENCGKSLSWREWELWAASEDSGAELINVIPGATIENMVIRCDCGCNVRLHRILICRDCAYSVLDSDMSKVRGTLVYKCRLGKRPNGKCFEERSF